MIIKIQANYIELAGNVNCRFRLAWLGLAWLVLLRSQPVAAGSVSYQAKKPSRLKTHTKQQQQPKKKEMKRAVSK